MIASATYTVYAEWMDEGALFLWGSRGKGSIDAAELKDHLFAWHEPSFYGTFIQLHEMGYREGVKLPAEEALDYFCSTQELRHVSRVWSEEVAALKALAPAVKDALDHGRYMPDYEQFKRGSFGWKLTLPEALEPLAAGDTARHFLHALAAERAASDPGLRAALARLSTRVEGEAVEGGDPNLWLDEEDFLAAIGWVADPSPFRTCLQLIEPGAEGEAEAAPGGGGGGWRLSVALQDRGRPDWLTPVSQSGEPAADVALPPAWAEALPRVPRDVQRWLHILPWLRDADAQADATGAASATDAASPAGLPRLKTELADGEAWELLTHGALRLAEAGCAVLLPAWWERASKRKPRLRAKVKSSVGAVSSSLLGLDGILQFDWRLAIGDIELTEGEFLQLLDEKKRLIRFHGEWIQLDPAQLDQIRQAMKRARKKRGLSFQEILEMHLLGEAPIPGTAAEGIAEDDRLMMEVELDDYMLALMDQLEHSSHIPLVEAPTDFHGSLRRYQAEGLSWMLFLRRLGLGGCLADDMGLGKTIQWITYLLAAKEQRTQRSVDSATATGDDNQTVITDTEQQLAPIVPLYPEDAPSLLICPTSVLGNWQKELERFAPSLKVHLHYGGARLKGKSFADGVKDADLILTSYTLANLDENELKSVYWSSICLDEAQNIKNAYTKQATAIRHLTGYHRIAMTGTPIENRLTELWSIFDFLNPGYLGSLRDFTHRFVTSIERSADQEATGKVQKLVRPFLLRRLKKDPAIQLDLPEKNEAKVYVSLTAEQASLYETHIRDMFERIEKSSAMERRGLILASLTRLKQVCNHPSLYLKEGGRRWKERSNKLERLIDMVRELRSEGDRCLIFTQFVETGHLLQKALEDELEESTLFLHGGTTKHTRDDMIARFQNETLPDSERPAIFILSLKAGGTGLNLTAANHVFHFDRWWNPAVENQATDRAYRIGQMRNVQVHKFITLGTMEERVDEMIERKLGLSQQIVGGGENWITELSTDELRELFRLRREWID
ncbi:DEAD/DEAH box helicase [Gorillibacterium massiliense]|uniref:DEAD/DEAH box helicase n=1 Tax=Gorillibacterium massiliense TaxID=1280390 RepID=UPI0004B7F756|nr:DEAD/DEAH box helicase [Gorillibacterium massiliense]